MGETIYTFTEKLNLICKKKPTICMGIPHIRCNNYGETMYQHLKAVLKNLIVGLSEAFEKPTKSWKLEFFNNFNISFLKLQSSIFAFAKKLGFAVLLMNR